jgi:hypothetical protein
MQISGGGAAHIPSMAGGSKQVPPGLQKRGLAVPPGIEKKLEAGGTKPPGIENRFPSPPPAPTDSSAAGSVTDTPATDSTTVDISV